MREYLSNFSAAAFWNIPYVEAIFGSVIAETGSTDLTFEKRSAISYKKGQVVHLCGYNLPLGAVVSRSGKIVASPELVFLDLASKLNIQRLILLGLQLCSHPPGNPSEAITTKKKLNSFIRKTPGYYGHRKASRAVEFIKDGSASVMESITYMILTLPHTLGGYGLDGAVFNYEIKLADEASKRLGRKRCFTDLYYRSARLAIEYESFAFHNSPSEQGKDSVRSATLERQGVEVMHVNTIQLYDKDACKDFAINLASRLGKRIQIRARKFSKMHESLRELLPAVKPGDET